MAYKYIVSTLIVKDIKNVNVEELSPVITVYDEVDLDKAKSYCKSESDINNPDYKIDVNIVYEEPKNYQRIYEGGKKSTHQFFNIPYARYIVRIEYLDPNFRNVLYSIRTITLNNIL